MDRIPVFVRAGAVLPADEDGRDVLHVYPDPAAAVTSPWYRDAGDGYGPHRVDELTVEPGGVVRRTVVEDGFTVEDTDLAIVVHGGPWTVAVDGAEPVVVAEGQALRVGDFTELAVRRPD
jgi:hypothetical protein